MSKLYCPRKPSPASQVSTSLMHTSKILSFGPLDRYLETQDSLLYAATRPNNQSQEAFWDEGAAGAGGTKKKETGLKRKTSEKGSRAQEVSFVSPATRSLASVSCRDERDKVWKLILFDIGQSLKKVNTSKMPKLTSFFRKKTD